MFDILPTRKKTRDLNFDNFFSEFIPDNFFPGLDAKMMRLDIKENDSSYIFDVELAGVKKENIDLVINDDILTINVKKESETNEQQINYIRNEIKYGSLSRSFAIPNIQKDNIRAKFDNGILQIVLPKITKDETDYEQKIDIE